MKDFQKQSFLSLLFIMMNYQNQNKPFLSLDTAKQHKIVILKMFIYVGLIIFYLSSFFTIRIKY